MVGSEKKKLSNIYVVYFNIPELETCPNEQADQNQEQEIPTNYVEVNVWYKSYPTAATATTTETPESIVLKPIENSPIHVKIMERPWARIIGADERCFKEFAVCCSLELVNIDPNQLDGT